MATYTIPSQIVELINDIGRSLKNIYRKLKINVEMS